MIIRSIATLTGIAVLLTACAANVTRPIEAIAIYTDRSIPAALAHIEDRRTADTRASSGDGIDVIYYGDDTLSPLPVQVLDVSLGEHLQAALQTRKVVVDRYTVAVLPVPQDYDPAKDIYGPSFVTSLLGSGSGVPTGDHRYECHLKGSFSGRNWWVKHTIPSSDKGRQADLEELIRQCNQEAITRIARIAG